MTFPLRATRMKRLAGEEAAETDGGNQ